MIVAVGDLVEGRVAALDVAHDDDPVGMRLLEHRAVDGGDIRPVVDVAEEEPIVAVPGGLVDAAQDLDMERVGDVAGDHAEQRAPAAAQRPGEEVRLVAEIRRRGEDPVSRRLANRDAGLAAVEDP